MANKNAIPPDRGFKDHPERINKNGRPRKLPNLDTLLADVLGEDKDGLTAAEAILKALRAKATKGDIRAAEVLLDRAYGKAINKMQQLDENGKPMKGYNIIIEKHGS